MTQEKPLQWKPYARFREPTVECPIMASMGVFGRKWALAVLRDIAFFSNVRFTDILRFNPGLTPRVLVLRLKELETDGFIRRVPAERGRNVYYELTPKGQDTVPILTSLVYFGSKHLAHRVFSDGKPRTMTDLLPTSQAELLGEFGEWVRGTVKRRAPSRKPNSKLRHAPAVRVQAAAIST